MVYDHRCLMFCVVQRTTELFTAPHAEVAPFSRVWNPDTNSVYEDPNDWPTESDDDDTITKDELYVSRCSPRRRERVLSSVTGASHLQQALGL